MPQHSPKKKKAPINKRPVRNKPKKRSEKN